MLIESELHKQINGNIEGEPFDVVFDSDGRAEVEEAVGELLLRLHAAKKITEAAEKEVSKSIDEMLKEMEFSTTGNISLAKEDMSEIIPQVEAITVEPAKSIEVETKKLSDMSLSELKAEASRLNIKIGTGKTQKQIIAKIEGGK